MENDEKKFSAKSSFFFGFFVGLSVFSLIGFLVLATMFIKKNNNNSVKENKESANLSNEQTSDEAGPRVISKLGTFAKVEGDICKEGGKPIIRLFSTTSCPHCQWVKDIYDKVAKDYVNKGKIKAYHWDLDKGDNTLTKEVETQAPVSEMQILAQFDPQGYVPAFIFGCQYFRIGTGYERENDLKKEESEFREVIDALLK